MSLLTNYNSIFCQGDFYQQITDTEFELGQYGIFYTKFCRERNLDKGTLFLVLDKLHQAELEKSSIFRLNWYSQMLWNTLESSLEKQHQTRKVMNFKKLKKFFFHTQFITERLLFYTGQPNFGLSYTNVLAVSFEALCFLLDISSTLGLRELCRKLVSDVFYVFLILE
jgi:hypothetical protein